MQRDLGVARKRLEECLTRYLDLRDPGGMLRVLHHLAQLALTEGDRVEARRHLTAALEWAPLAEDSWNTSKTTWELGRLALEEGDDDQAAALGSRAVAAYEAVGDSHGQSGALMILGEVALRAGDLATAHKQYERALHQVRGTCKVCTENALYGLAQVLKAEGDTATADSLLAQRRELRVELGLPLDNR
jgi:tetratricopeptide (TPR) repeat protein